MTTLENMLPDRELDLRARARQIMAEQDLPAEIHAYRHTMFSVEDILVELLAWRAESQTRVDGGLWQYTYDPVTADRGTLAPAILDAARIRLGCHEWGCRTAADLDQITFLDGDENLLDRNMEREQ